MLDLHIDLFIFILYCLFENKSSLAEFWIVIGSRAQLHILLLYQCALYDTLIASVVRFYTNGSFAGSCVYIADTPHKQ